MVDVSSNNHENNQPINWHQVTGAGYEAVIIKSTEGMKYVNPWLVRDANGAHAVGLHVGFYHFAIPLVGNASAQAEHALSAVQGLPRDLGLSLDLEVQNGVSWPDLSTWAQNFLARVAQEKVGSPFYSNQYFLSQLPGAPFGHKLWLAQDNKPRGNVWAWQSTTPRAVPGIPGLTDVDVWYGASA